MHAAVWEPLCRKTQLGWVLGFRQTKSGNSLEKWEGSTLQHGTDLCLYNCDGEAFWRRDHLDFAAPCLAPGNRCSTNNEGVDEWIRKWTNELWSCGFHVFFFFLISRIGTSINSWPLGSPPPPTTSIIPLGSREKAGLGVHHDFTLLSVGHWLLPYQLLGAR